MREPCTSAVRVHDGVCLPEESRPGQVTCRRSQQSLETLLETLPARARLARSVAAAMEVCCPARVPAGMPMRLSSSAATARAESGSEPH